jgi:hypothetical protein
MVLRDRRRERLGRIERQAPIHKQARSKPGKVSALGTLVVRPSMTAATIINTNPAQIGQLVVVKSVGPFSP